MKNRIIFIIGLLLLITMVWATTMIGIKHNSKKEEQTFLIPFIKQIDKKMIFEII